MTPSQKLARSITNMKSQEGVRLFSETGNKTNDGCCGSLRKMTNETVADVGKNLNCGSCALIFLINLLLPGLGTIISVQFIPSASKTAKSTPEQN